jgi:hypothetical protein
VLLTKRVRKSCNRPSIEPWKVELQSSLPTDSVPSETANGCSSFIMVKSSSKVPSMNYQPTENLISINSSLEWRCDSF